MSEKENAVEQIRAFNRFYMPLLRLLDNHYLGSEYTPTEARVLFEIYQNDGCNAAYIAKTMNIDKSYLSRILRAHEKKGFLAKSVSEADARAYRLHLTEAGRHKTIALIGESNRLIGEIISPLHPEECGELVSALHTITAILGRCYSTD